MPNIRIWTLESDIDAKVVKCLANKLVTHLQSWEYIYPSCRSTSSSEKRNRRGDISKRQVADSCSELSRNNSLRELGTVLAKFQ